MGRHPAIDVATDTQTNGPTPGLNSMLSLGSAVYDRNEWLMWR